MARIELSSNGKMVYLRIEESATEVWFKVELHRVMDDTKAKEWTYRRQGYTGEVWNIIEAGGVYVHAQKHHQNIRN